MNRNSFPAARRLRTGLLGLAAIGLGLLSPARSSAAVAITSWSSETTGTLGSVTVSAGPVDNEWGLEAADISGANFCPAGSATSGMPRWDPTFGTLTLGFSAPLTNPNLYLVFFRGSSVFGPADGFSFGSVGGTCSWSIFSGLSGATLTGNVLTATNYASGVLRCTGTVSGLTISGVNQDPATSGFQLVNVGTGDDSCGGSATATPTVAGPTATPSVAGPTPTPAPGGPIAYYPFNETSGTVAADAIRGAGGNGTLFGFSSSGWVPGKIGNGLQFNGTSSYVKAPMLPAAYQALTIGAWVKLNGFTQYGQFVSNWGGSVIGSFLFGLTENEPIRIFNRIGFSDDTFTGTTTSSTLNLGQWYYVGLTFDNTTARIYIDGQLVAEELVTPGKTINQRFSEFLTFGAKLDDTQTVPPAESFFFPSYLDGILDELVFFDRALSQTELVAASEGSIPGVDPVATPTPGAVTNIIGNRTSPSRDKKGCQVQWRLTSQTPELNRFGAPRNEQSCVDGDPACDRNPAAGVCGFEVATCLNNADSRLPECQASGIGSVLVRDPWARVSMPDALRQLIGQNRASLQEAVLNVADPINPGAGYSYRPPLSAAQQGFCSAPFTVNVPVEVATSRKKKRTLTLSTISTSANARARSTLKLTCRSLPGGGVAPTATPTVVVPTPIPPTPSPTVVANSCPLESGSTACLLTTAGEQIQICGEYNYFYGFDCTTDADCEVPATYCRDNLGLCRCIKGSSLPGAGYADLDRPFCGPANDPCGVP